MQEKIGRARYPKVVKLLELRQLRRSNEEGCRRLIRSIDGLGGQVSHSQDEPIKLLSILVPI